MRHIPVCASVVLWFGFPAWLGTGCNAPDPPLHSQREAPLSTSFTAPVLAQPVASLSESGTTSIQARDFELRDWFAFGSGCRSRAGSPGDVDIQLFEEPEARGAYRLHFTLMHYGIRPSDPLLARIPTFARECGIRLAIYPKPGSKLAGVSARPTYHVEKPLGPEVRLRSRLFTGDTQLARFERRFGPTQSVSDQSEETSWQVGMDASRVFKGLACEQPKLVGLDLSVAVIREQSGKEEVIAELTRGELELKLEFAACSSSNVSQLLP